MIQFVHDAETAEDKILNRRRGRTVAQAATTAETAMPTVADTMTTVVSPAVKSVKRGRRSLKALAAVSEPAAKTAVQEAVVPGDPFAATRLYTIQTAAGKTCIFNGFEIAQMLTAAAKSALLNGATTVTDGPYCIVFYKDLSDTSLK